MKPQFWLILVILVIGVSLTGCLSTPTPKAQKIDQSAPADLSKCRFLGQVSGTSAHSSLSWLDGERKAKNDAMDLAASMGATHIIWVKTTGGTTPTALGKAYKCPTGQN